jgi:hypothetical protein
MIGRQRRGRWTSSSTRKHAAPGKVLASQAMDEGLQPDGVLRKVDTRPQTATASTISGTQPNEDEVPCFVQLADWFKG